MEYKTIENKLTQYKEKIKNVFSTNSTPKEETDTIIKEIDKDSLEYKLLNYKFKIINTLKKEELTEKEINQYTSKYLKEEGINDENNQLASYLSTLIMHINPMTIHFGLENIYVSIKNKPIVSTKKQKDIENYNKIKELTTKYAKTIDTTKINETEFQKKITNYISTKQEINNLKDEKKEKISSLIYTFIKMDNDFKFKQEEITLGGYKITEINKAIDKIRYI
jgi:hypothetical protein